MKLIREHINESIKHLKPRSEEEIRSYYKHLYKNLSPLEKLYHGIMNNLLFLVEDAIEEDVDIHDVDNNNREEWPLRLSAYYNKFEIFGLLIKHGADIDVALATSVKNNFVKSYQKLIEFKEKLDKIKN